MEAYPLQWPSNWPRSKRSQYSRFGPTTIEREKNEILEELRMMGAKEAIISTNLKLRRDGFPYSSQKQPEDKGVAVYFKLKGKPQCIPCDRWSRIEDNMRAITKTINALRGIKRWGADEMVNAAFTGFKALPTGTGDSRPWYEILEVTENAMLEDVEKSYKNLAFKNHPDRGGSQAKMVSINAAWESAQIASR